MAGESISSPESSIEIPQPPWRSAVVISGSKISAQESSGASSPRISVTRSTL